MAHETRELPLSNANSMSTDPNDKGATWRKHTNALMNTYVIVTEERPQQFSEHLDIRGRLVEMIKVVPLLVHVKQFANTRSLFIHPSCDYQWILASRKEKLTNIFVHETHKRFLGPNIIRWIRRTNNDHLATKGLTRHPLLQLFQNVIVQKISTSLKY